RLQQVERQPFRPFAVEPLEPEDLRQDFRGKANVLLKEPVEISPRIAGLLLQFPDRNSAACGSKRADAISHDAGIVPVLSQHDGQALLDTRDLLIHRLE